MSKEIETQLRLIRSELSQIGCGILALGVAVVFGMCAGSFK